jgi:peptide/nickel transport system permease protein
MPATSLGWFLVAANTRLVRSSMLDAGLGLSRWYGPGHAVPRGDLKHALKTALPIVTLFAVNFASGRGGGTSPSCLAGDWPAPGGVHLRGITVIQTVVFFSATIIVLINIVVDLCYYDAS